MFSHVTKVRILTVIFALIVGLSPLSVFAAVITVTNQPSFTSGITSFTITYVSNTEMDLNWTVDGTVANVMVRAKYGQYPADIPDENTAPTDGYLVYYGTDLSAVDTSMDFDSNLGTLYYKAWAQKADGTWYVTTSTSSKESEVVTLILLFGFGLAISGFAIAKKEVVIAIIAPAIWVATIYYTRQNPIGSMTTGDPADTAILLALLGLLAGVPIVSWRLGRSDRTREAKDDDYKNRVAPKRNQTPIGTRETSDQYYDRLNGVTHPKRK